MIEKVTIVIKDMSTAFTIFFLKQLPMIEKDKMLWSDTQHTNISLHSP